jgi:hypothetical protein
MMFNHGFLFLVEQVSEEVERALAKLGPANLGERYFFCHLNSYMI